MRTIVQQLAFAFEDTEWSVQQLLDKSRLPIARSTLSRKLKGELRMNVDEAQQLAKTMGTILVWGASMTLSQAVLAVTSSSIRVGRCHAERGAS